MISEVLLWQIMRQIQWLPVVTITSFAPNREKIAMCLYVNSSYTIAKYFYDKVSDLRWMSEWKHKVSTSKNLHKYMKEYSSKL
jgi:hypothetical protein